MVCSPTVANNCGPMGCRCGVAGACTGGLECTNNQCVMSVVSTLFVGTHSTIFTGNARGFWFTAPVNFTIVGLRIPIEAGISTQLQTVEVVRFPGAVPAFATPSTTHVSLGRFTNQPGSTFITTSLAITTGDIIGIVGYRGTNVASSYAGANTLASSILGQPLTLSRLGTNVSMATAPATALWTETGNELARIEVQYTP